MSTDHSAHKAKSNRLKMLEHFNAKAGRNIFLAIITGIIFAVIIFLSLVIYRPLFMALVSIVSIICIFELSQLFRIKKVQIPSILLSISSVGIIAASFFAGLQMFSFMYIIAFFVIALYVALYPYKEQRIKATLTSTFTLTYISFPLGFACLILETFDLSAIFLCVIIAVATDFGGYWVGRFFGKKHIFPNLSPNKTLEGYLGSLLLVSIVSTIFCLLAPIDVHDKPLFIVLVTLIGVLMCVFGDLAESLLKRSLHVSDSSNNLPGHGGFLDRIDSMIFWLPCFYLLFSFFEI